ncbi:MAG: peptidoglycan-binding protein [Clostridiales bacterium]|jgi:peptidoglycan hydrolase-like protein with peptidoglycan-binding domain|nr:peptidoglycan-binding protein [Clostridiales bacterium]
MAIGYLRVTLRLGGDALPALGVTVLIQDQNNNPLYNLLTNRDGNTEYVPLEISPTEIAGVSHNISFFKVEIPASQLYGSVYISNVEVYAGLSSTLPIEMRPLIKNASPSENTQIMDVPREHGADYRGAPEANSTPLTELYGLTNTVKIPDYITVHLGYYTSSAQNIRIPYKDYLKNVASSEIYADWLPAALYANIYCQITYTLNRLYTVWYRSQGYAFDITSSTQTDQKYTVGKAIPDNISRIVDEIFNVYLRRAGRNEPFFSAYCDGKNTLCQNGLWQWGSEDLAEKGYSTMQILRYYYPADVELAESNVFTSTTETYPGYVLKQGMSGENVKLMQDYLNRISGNYWLPKLSNPNGVFDAETTSAVKAFQSEFNLTSDGIIGKATWYKITYIYAAVKRLAESESEGERIGIATTPPTVTIGPSSDYNQITVRQYIAEIQYILNYLAQFYNTLPTVIEDSRYTQTTQDAVKAFQSMFNLPVTGTVNAATWQKLYQVYWSVYHETPQEPPEVPPETTPTPPSGTYPEYPGYLLRIGASGENVLIMQEYLRALSQRYTSIPAITPDGQFGTATQNAVIAFQRLFGLSADGIIGRDTWSRIVYEYNNQPSLPETPSNPVYPGYLIAVGSQGQYVTLMQTYLNAISQAYPSIPSLTPDGKFGPATQNAVIEFQRLFGLSADGIIGQGTWNKIIEIYNGLSSGTSPGPSNPSYPAYPGYLLKVGSSGENVHLIQNYLNTVSTRYPDIPKVTADGIFGSGTANAVKAFQRLFGLTADGIVGKSTWDSLAQNAVSTSVQTVVYQTQQQALVPYSSSGLPSVYQDNLVRPILSFMLLKTIIGLNCGCYLR